MLAEKVKAPINHVEDFMNPTQKELTYKHEELLANVMMNYMATTFYKGTIYDKDTNNEYKDVLDKLFDYMEKENIYMVQSTWTNYASICFDKNHEHAVFLLDPHYFDVLTVPQTIAVIAHELGHYLDFKHYEKPDKAFIVELEMVAWALAEDILKAVGYNAWKDFEDVKKFGLMSYVDENIHKYNFYMNQFEEIVLNHIA